MGWKAAVICCLAVSGVSLGISAVLNDLPDALVPPLFVVLGATAWLLWGFVMPFYLVATGLFAASLTGVLLLHVQSRHFAPFAPWFAVLAWLMLGLWAWNVTI